MKNLAKHLFSIFIILLITGNSWAENNKVKFGKVSLEELKMNVYDQDTSAVAVILYDSGESLFKTEYKDKTTNFICKFERHVRIKILKPQGFDFATLKIPIYHGEDEHEKIELLKARTYNLEEKIIVDKLDKKSIFHEDTSPNWKITKLTMPNIKVGSVIEFKYQISSPFLQNLRSWQFQYSIPVIFSKYRTIIPEYFNYQKTMKGYYPIITSEKGIKTETFTYKYRELNKFSAHPLYFERELELSPSSDICEYSAENIPAFESESYMLSKENYLTRLEFELQSYQIENGAVQTFTSTWKSVHNKLINSFNFGEALKRNKFLADITLNIINNEQSEEEKTSIVFQTVQNNTKWDGLNRLFCKKTLRNTWKEKSGNSAEINLLLVAMLREAGIKANPVVLSTRQNGIIHPSHPTITQLNYVIACANINGNNYLMDATDPYCPIGILPFRCLNNQGRLITENSSEWIKIDPKQESKIAIMSNLKLTEEGILTGKVTEAFYNYKGVNKRKEISNNTEEYTEQLESDYEDWNISKIEYKNLNDRNKPLQIRYSTEIEDLANMEGQKIYLNPILKYKFLENPFKLEQREYPVNFGYPTRVIYTMILELPNNYIIEEQPEPTKIALPESGGSYSYLINQTANKVVVKYNFKTGKSQYLPYEYEDLKEFYNQVIAKENQILVLKKIEPTAER